MDSMQPLPDSLPTRLGKIVPPGSLTTILCIHFGHKRGLQVWGQMQFQTLQAPQRLPLY